MIHDLYYCSLPRALNINPHYRNARARIGKSWQPFIVVPFVQHTDIADRSANASTTYQAVCGRAPRPPSIRGSSTLAMLYTRRRQNLTPVYYQLILASTPLPHHRLPHSPLLSAVEGAVLRTISFFLCSYVARIAKLNRVGSALSWFESEPLSTVPTWTHTFRGSVGLNVRTCLTREETYPWHPHLSISVCLCPLQQYTRV